MKHSTWMRRSTNTKTQHVVRIKPRSTFIFIYICFIFEHFAHSSSPLSASVIQKNQEAPKKKKKNMKACFLTSNSITRATDQLIIPTTRAGSAAYTKRYSLQFHSRKAGIPFSVSCKFFFTLLFFLPYMIHRSNKKTFIFVKEKIFSITVILRN